MRSKQAQVLNRAVVLLSGGLDSATVLYTAKKRGFLCHCLIFDYGQRHKREIESAKKIAKAAGCAYKVLKISLPWKGSSLLNKKELIPQANNRITKQGKNIPSTYVPGRNIIFLSFALSFAEAISAQSIFIGAHIQDYSDYPDCRREFFQAFESVIRKGTRLGRQGKAINICTPLLNKSKSGIIKSAVRLGVPLEMTWSCYRGASRPCGKCDSCHFRAKGFLEAGIRDTL